MAVLVKKNVNKSCAVLVSFCNRSWDESMITLYLWGNTCCRVFLYFIFIAYYWRTFFCTNKRLYYFLKTISKLNISRMVHNALIRFFLGKEKGASFIDWMHSMSHMRRPCKGKESKVL